MIERKKYNYLGKDISDLPIQLIDSAFGYVDNANIPHINWAIENDICDSEGFDKRYRPIDGSDDYLITDYLIPKGTIICRYGFPGGRFSTLKGTDYETLGLPYIKESIEYHEYKVSEDLSVTCYVKKGIVGPMFSSIGGGIQFKHKQPFFLECEDGCLQEDCSWIQKDI